VAPQKTLTASFDIGLSAAGGQTNKTQDIKTIKLQALRADLKAALARHTGQGRVSELFMQGGEQPTLWIDAHTKVVMDPDPNTYRFLDAQGQNPATRFATPDWYEMHKFIMRHLTSVPHAMAASRPLQKWSNTSKFFSSVVLAWIFGLTCGALVTTCLPVILQAFTAVLR
jgi:hypothetical protein